MKFAHLLKTIIPIFVVILALSVISCSNESTSINQQFKDISPQEALTLIQENQDNPEFIILDVRTPAEFLEGHIEKAINIDFNSSDFKNEINKLDRNKEYLVYCRSGNRSKGALNVMKELGFQNVYHLYEGIIGWTNNGYSTVK